MALSAITAGTSGTNIVKTNQVFFDTGATAISGPPAEIQALFSLVPATAGINADPSNPGRYLINCNTFPDLTIRFGAAPNEAFVIPGKSLEVTLSSGGCYLKISTNSLGMSSYKNGRKNWLMSLSGTWRLGTPFLSTVYSRERILLMCAPHKIR